MLYFHFVSSTQRPREAKFETISHKEESWANILRVSVAGMLVDGPHSEAKKSREAATAYSNLQTLFFSSSHRCLAVLIA